MNILDRIRIAGSAFRSGTYWEQVLGGIESSSGANVNNDTALTYSAVWSALTLTTETMSTIPLQLFRRTDNGRELYRDSQLYGVLHDQANRVETAQSFRETFIWNMEMSGIGISEIVRNGRGVAELWNINPDELTEVRRVGSRLEFIIGGRVYTQDQIFYCYGPGRKGLTPRGRIHVARDAIGLGMSMQTYGGKFFKNGTNVGSTLIHPSKLGDTAYKRLKDSLASQYTGADNANKNLILEEGMKLERSNMSNEDSQFLESRKFQISDIARFFGVKSHMIGDLERATFSNIEQQGIEAVTYCWRPRAVRIEQAINMQLIRSKDVYAEHNLDGLMQGDFKSQMEAWHIGLQDGVFNANEVRAKLNMNDQPGDQGEMYFFPMNMQDKSNPGEQEDEDQRSLYSVVMQRAIDTYGPMFSAEQYRKSAKNIVSAAQRRGNSKNDIVQLRNALTLAAMQSSGVTHVRWVSEPGCTVCQHLNGKIVPIGDAFEGKSKHPPLSEGCACSIVDASDSMI